MSRWRCPQGVPGRGVTRLLSGHLCACTTRQGRCERTWRPFLPVCPVCAGRCCRCRRYGCPPAGRGIPGLPRWSGFPVGHLVGPVWKAGKCVREVQPAEASALRLPPGSERGPLRSGPGGVRRCQRAVHRHLRPEDVAAEFWSGWSGQDGLQGAAGCGGDRWRAGAARRLGQSSCGPRHRPRDSVEDFHRARFLYQLTRHGQAALRAVAVYDEARAGAGNCSRWPWRTSPSN